MLGVVFTFSGFPFSPTASKKQHSQVLTQSRYSSEDPDVLTRVDFASSVNIDINFEENYARNGGTRTIATIYGQDGSCIVPRYVRPATTTSGNMTPALKATLINVKLLLLCQYNIL